MKNKKNIILIILTIILIIIDQIIKLNVFNKLYNSSISVINGVLSLTYIQNTGGAYGVGTGNIVSFIIVNIIVIGLIIRFLILKNNQISNSIRIGLFMIIAGGLSNLIDRIYRGFVIDYIDFSKLIKFPIFNFADVCIVIGCIILIISIIKSSIKK